MYHANHPFRPAASDQGSGHDDMAAGVPLRQLDWGELAARLSAARDLRTFIGASRGSEAASFDAPSARWIAEHRENPDFGSDYQINPDASANCKRAVGKMLPSTLHQTDDPRI